MTFARHDTVILRSFLGTQKAPEDVALGDNYWKLIGKKGVVIRAASECDLPRHAYGERVLVVFDVDVAGKGLHCHNEVKNSLWIFISDLQKFENDK